MKEGRKGRKKKEKKGGGRKVRMQEKRKER